MRADQAGVLWKRWRLLEDRELYNLETDPLQQTNVIDQHPEVVVKLRKRLTEWWDRVGAAANEEQRIIVGTKHENPTKLSATEWLDVFVDQQGQVRRGQQKSGYWLIDVARLATTISNFAVGPKRQTARFRERCQMEQELRYRLLRRAYTLPGITT